MNKVRTLMFFHRGKPKRGRGGGPRDGRRNKHSSEPDFDYDDDPDVIL